MSGEDPQEIAAQLRGSALFDAAWYRQRHPDVARLGIDPALHYARIGLALGRDPGPGFSVPLYLAANPDVAAAGVPALLHYLRAGRAEGRARHPAPPAPGGPVARAQHLRGLLERGGLTEGPLTALAALAAPDPAAAPEAQAAAALAAETLAVWCLRDGDPEAARHWCARRLEIGTSAAVEARLAPLQALAAARLADRVAIAALLAAHPEDPGLRLAAMNAETDPSARVAHLDAALRLCDLAGVTLGPGSGPALDRLVAEMAPNPESLAPGAPRVSVILAMRDAAGTLPTALRSVLAQDWRALELIVVDDASRDNSAALAAAVAATDPRVRLIRLPHNRGAYGARNAGLAEASGAYVTLHDADDWAHPERLSRQLGFLRDMPGHAGCLSLQARVDGELSLTRWTGTGAVLHENLASLLLPRQLMLETLGGWDEVRVSADSELLRRVRDLFGARAVPTIACDGPLCLQRDAGGNATADSATGMDWFYYGARAEYHEAQAAHHARATTLFYAPGGPRPFPAPAILLPDATRGYARDAVQAFDLVLAGYLCAAGPDLDALVARLDAARAADARVGLVALHGMHLSPGPGLGALPAIRDRIDGAGVAMLCRGERARAPEVRIFGPPPPPLRHLPEIFEGAHRVLGPDTPRSALEQGL